MRSLPDDIQTWLLGAAPTLAGAREGRVDIELTRHIARPEAEVYFCVLRSASGVTPVCVKRFTTLGTRDLVSLFRRAAHLQDTMRAGDVACPRLLACNVSLAVMVMNVVPGTPLERCIIRSFFGGKRAFEACESAVRRSARAIATMHELPIPSAAPMARTCSNREYVDRLKRSALPDPFVTGTLADSAFDPGTVLKALPGRFWEREESRLLHGDFQAKNILVEGASVTLIDVDYGLGHPLRDVAQFLTQLERLYRRWRFPRARRLLQAYGATFCEEFSRQGFAHLMEDLPFFRLWTVAFALLADRHSTWPVRRLIRHDLREGRSGLVFSPAHRNWMRETRNITGP